MNNLGVGKNFKWERKPRSHREKIKYIWLHKEFRILCKNKKPKKQMKRQTMNLGKYLQHIEDIQG